MSRLNKVLQQTNVTEHKKKKAKQKKTVMPVYDMTGKTITPEKKRRENRIAVAVIFVTVLLSFLYLPGLFIEDNKEIVNTNAAVKIDSTAIRKSNTALRNNAEEDFDSHTFPVICFFCKDLQTPLCLYYRDLIRLFITNRDSRRIIPSVLQL